jgi:hypothetical protein
MTAAGGVRAEFANGRSRVENGIAYADDTLVTLAGSCKHGYRAEPRVPLTPAQLASPDGWTELDDPEAHRVQNQQWIVSGGETSFEGEGFVAARRADTGALLWVLCLDDSERFVDLVIDGDTITARSGGYPDAYHWTISIHAPECLTVTPADPD